jgi:hypothetical protein
MTKNASRVTFTILLKKLKTIIKDQEKHKKNTGADTNRST